MSWSPEVQTGNDKKFYGNSLRFATKEEAEFSAKGLMLRWTLVVDWRVVESDEPVNYQINLKTGELSAVTKEAV